MSDGRAICVRRTAQRHLFRGGSFAVYAFRLRDMCWAKRWGLCRMEEAVVMNCRREGE